MIVKKSVNLNAFSAILRSRKKFQLWQKPYKIQLKKSYFPCTGATTKLRLSKLGIKANMWYNIIYSMNLDSHSKNVDFRSSSFSSTLQLRSFSSLIGLWICARPLKHVRQNVTFASSLLIFSRKYPMSCSPSRERGDDKAYTFSIHMIYAPVHSGAHLFACSSGCYSSNNNYHVDQSASQPVSQLRQR